MAMPLIEAQISYTSADYAVANDQVSYLSGNTNTTTNFVSTGANYQWDFSSIQPQGNVQASYGDPTTTGYKNIWCQFSGYSTNCDSQFASNFNMAKKLTDAPVQADDHTTLENVYAHYQKSNSDLSIKMLGVKITSFNTDLSMTLDYQQPDLMYKFPMNYNDSYTEAFSYHGDLSPVGFNFKASSIGQRTNIVDGYGDLKISDQSFYNVLRVKTVSEQVLTTVINGVSQDRTIITTNYQWFSKDYKFPVLDVSTITTNGTIVPTEIRYLKSSGTLSTISNSKQTSFIYPNPSKGDFKTTIPKSDIKSIEVYNQNGQLVSTSLNLTGLNKGNYTVVVKTATQNLTQKVIKE